MIEEIGKWLLWALAIGAVVFAVCNQPPPGRSTVREWKIGGFPGVAGILGAALFMLLLAGCGEPKRVVTALPIPPERMDCVKTSKRPTLPPEYVIDWSRVSTVEQARAEHGKFVASIRAREGRVAGYILEVEGELFACSNDAAWLRDWQNGLAN